MNKEFINYHRTPIGWCWIIGKCDWWNPPLDFMLDSLGKINFCIKCWEFLKKR